MVRSRVSGIESPEVRLLREIQTVDPRISEAGQSHRLTHDGGGWPPGRAYESPRTIGRKILALALPAITLAIATIPFYLRVSRATTLDALRSDHVRTARATGLSERSVIWRHGFRVGMLPLLTLVGMDLAFFLGGLVVIENVFSWPGIGQQAVNAISQEDIPVLMGTLLFATFCVVDIIHALLNRAAPRGLTSVELDDPSVDSRSARCQGPYHAGMRPLPEGDVAFLFSDIEGSTRLLERFGAHLTTAMGAHHDLLTSPVQAHDGVVFETVGDAVYAAFSDPMDAALAAAACHRAMATTDWGELGDVRVRIALHRGPVELRGDHYISPALFRTARIQALGHGGQTLVSDEMARSIADGLPEDLTLRSLGRHRLKDLVDAEVVHQLDAIDLPATFPPLRAVDARIDTLPRSLSSFLGREEDVAAIGAALRTGRLVTLTGPGGTGKTRLAIEAARAAGGGFAEGVLFADLAPVREPDQAAAAIVSVLGVRPIGDETPERALSRWLADREVLLVLDNLEQVIESAPMFVRLLDASPSSRLLATSRVRLRVRGETVIPVPPMDLDGGRGMSLAALLFIERAPADTAGHAAGDRSVIEDICRRLDGLPLAIELAAARAGSLTPARILRLLDDRLALLTGGDRDLPERQRTLAATIAWSLDLLQPSERRLFERLGVFIGGWSLDAAVEVAGDGDELRTVDGLRTLADASLIRVLPPDPLGEPRYTMLETTREAALAALEPDDRADALARHGAWMAGLAERAEPELVRGRAPDWLRLLDQEMPNLRLAMGTAIATGAARTAHRIAGALWRLGFLRGEHLAEVTRWGRDALAMAGAIDPRTRARTQVGYASVGTYTLPPGDLEPLLLEAVDVLQPLGPSNDLAEAFNALGVNRSNHGIRDEVERWLESAADVWGELGDHRGRGIATMGMAIQALEQGHPERASALTDAALRESRMGDSPLSLMEDLANATGILILVGRTDDAHGLALEVGTLRERTGYADPFFDLNFGGNLADLLLLAGRHEDAARLSGATWEATERFGAATESFESMRAVSHSLLREMIGSSADALIEEGRELDVTAAVDHGMEIIRRSPDVTAP
jgi:predicted ATPase